MSKASKTDKTRQLTVEQENAVDLLLQGKSDREVAEAVGVSRQTVWEWRNRNAVFVAELNKRRQEIWGSQIERLRRLVAEAVDVLEDDLRATEERRLRQSAAVHILKAVGLYGSELEPKGEMKPEDVEDDWRHEEFMKDLCRFQ